VLSDAHVNEPTVPDKTGAFATISNKGSAVVNLTGASVPADVAASAQVHETKNVGGEMQMTQIAEVPVPAGGQLVLKSGGYHVMLMNPKVTLGQVVPLTLRFSDGSAVTIDAPVKAAAAMASGSPSSMG
jgi:copper(I)-binding protein